MRRTLPTVISLFTSRRPAAIAGGIGTVVVDAVDTVCGAWASSHIGEKIGVVVPARVDGNASASIILKRFDVWIIASRTKSAPNPPLRSLAAFSMTGIDLTDAFRPQTPAGYCVPSFQIVGEDGFFVSAIAPTQPTSASRSNIGEGNNKQSAKTQSCDINRFGHVVSPEDDASSGDQMLQHLVAAPLYHTVL